MKRSLFVMPVFLLSASVAVAAVVAVGAGYALMQPLYEVPGPFVNVYYSRPSHPSWYASFAGVSEEVSVETFIERNVNWIRIWNKDPWTSRKFIVQGGIDIKCTKDEAQALGLDKDDVIACWSYDMGILSGHTGVAQLNDWGARIFLNPGVYEKFPRKHQFPETVFARTLAHEAGHVVGLADLSEGEHLMGKGSAMGTPQLSDGDIAGMRAMYPFPAECAALMVEEPGRGVVLYLDNVYLNGHIYSAVLQRNPDWTFIPIGDIKMAPADGMPAQCRNYPLYIEREDLTLSVPVISTIDPNGQVTSEMREYSLYLTVHTTPSISFVADGYEPK